MLPSSRLKDYIVLKSMYLFEYPHEIVMYIKFNYKHCLLVYIRVNKFIAYLEKVFFYYITTTKITFFKPVISDSMNRVGPQKSKLIQPFRCEKVTSTSRIVISL